MTFPYDSGMVPGALKKPGHGIQRRVYDTAGISRQYMRLTVPKRIPPRQNAVAGRRTDRGGSVGIGKLKPLPAQPVQIRRLNLMASIAAQIPEPQIVRIHDDHIALFVHDIPPFFSP